jgi:hypothetical protein
MRVNVQKALAAIVSVRVLHGNMPSLQCKMGFDWSKSMGKADGLKLILIDLYIAALTL